MPDSEIHDIGRRVDALVQEALQSDEISKFLVDEGFARQAHHAAQIIVEKYLGNDKEGRIVQGVIKAANAIRTRVRVFVSYKEKYEHDTRKIVNALRAWAGPKLSIWYAHDISPGDDWMQALFEQVTAAHWFLLLLPDPADNWGWQLYRRAYSEEVCCPVIGSSVCIILMCNARRSLRIINRYRRNKMR